MDKETTVIFIVAGVMILIGLVLMAIGAWACFVTWRKKKTKEEWKTVTTWTK